jgi:putative heme iron utilization protein
LLLSRLAAHTQNLSADPRAGLFVGDRSAAADPQAGARISLLGHVVSVDSSEEADARARYLARWPQAADYFALGDFSLWRFEIDEARLIAGFGDIRWLEGSALRT